MLKPPLLSQIFHDLYMDKEFKNHVTGTEAQEGKDKYIVMTDLQRKPDTTL